MQYTDQYCDVVDLLWDIFLQYFMDSIKQSYKVVFSMELLGDPSELLHQWKTGFSDLLFKTREFKPKKCFLLLRSEKFTSTHQSLIRGLLRR